MRPDSRTRTQPVLLALVTDIVCVVVFCTAGRPVTVRQADVAKAGQSSSADNKLSSSSAISCSPRPRSLRCIARFRTALSNGS